jgi:SAM-dependent methyltransferase
VSAIDPDPASLTEAESRAREMNFPVRFLGTGDIRQVTGTYDVVCYNFSLHYIFESEQIFTESLEAMARAVKPGGLLIGITPELARAELLTNGGQFKDPMGNTLEIKDGRLWVSLTDGPFYAGGGPKSEPMLDAFDLTQALTWSGFTRLVWEPMLPVPNGHVSDLYSSFVFRKN